MTKIPTYRPGPSGGASYQAKPAPVQRDGPREKRIYDRSAWRRKGGCRALKLAKNPLCERCLLDGRGVKATDVHHRIDLKDEPSLAFDLANLESLCHPCHSEETRKRQRHESPRQA